MADKTVQVKRLSLNRQAVQEFSMRPPPKLPTAMVKRFPELAAYDQAWQSWANDTQSIIRGLLTLKLDG